MINHGVTDNFRYNKYWYSSAGQALLLLLLLQGATSASTASPGAVSLNATVTGLGPAFKLTLELCNSGSESVLEAALVSTLLFDGSHVCMGPTPSSCMLTVCDRQCFCCIVSAFVALWRNMSQHVWSAVYSFL